MATDRIEKRAVLDAPRSRVWRAIADSREFGRWFGAAFDGPFVAGARVPARITEPEAYAGTPFDVWVERVEPEHLLSFRWHPGEPGPDFDEATAPTTLVELRLTDVPGGCELVIVESGFDAIPQPRRDKALRSNASGWEEQLRRVARHVG
jgi:uncharacterized protein YndB with AHSA1/START domain